MVFSVGVSSDEESDSEGEPVPTGSLSQKKKARQERFARKDFATALQKRIHRSLFDENRQVIKSIPHKFKEMEFRVEIRCDQWQ